MTIGGIHPYIASQLSTLGLREWKDGFNTANIPSNVLNNSFHVSVGSISSSGTPQSTHEFRAPVKVQLFFKGYRDPQSAKDAAMDKGQQVLGLLLSTKVRLSTLEGLKDIRPVTITPQPLAQSNDNSLILEMVFECFLIYAFG